MLKKKKGLLVVVLLCGASSAHADFGIMSWVTGLFWATKVKAALPSSLGIKPKVASPTGIGSQRSFVVVPLDRVAISRNKGKEPVETNKPKLSPAQQLFMSKILRSNYSDDGFVYKGQESCKDGNRTVAVDSTVPGSVSGSLETVLGQEEVFSGTFTGSTPDDAFYSESDDEEDIFNISPNTTTNNTLFFALKKWFLSRMGAAPMEELEAERERGEALKKTGIAVAEKLKEKRKKVGCLQTYCKEEKQENINKLARETEKIGKLAEKVKELEKGITSASKKAVEYGERNKTNFGELVGGINEEIERFHTTITEQQGNAGINNSELKAKIATLSSMFAGLQAHLLEAREEQGYNFEIKHAQIKSLQPLINLTQEAIQGSELSLEEYKAKLLNLSEQLEGLKSGWQDDKDTIKSLDELLEGHQMRAQNAEGRLANVKMRHAIDAIRLEPGALELRIKNQRNKNYEVVAQSFIPKWVSWVFRKFVTAEDYEEIKNKSQKDLSSVGYGFIEDGTRGIIYIGNNSREGGVHGESDALSLPSNPNK